MQQTRPPILSTANTKSTSSPFDCHSSNLKLSSSTQKAVNDCLRKRGLVIRVLSRIPGLISRDQRELCHLVADSLGDLMAKYQVSTNHTSLEYVAQTARRKKTTQRRKTLEQVIEVANLRGPLLRSSSLCPEELWIVSFRRA